MLWPTCSTLWPEHWSNLTTGAQKVLQTCPREHSFHFCPAPRPSASNLTSIVRAVCSQRPPRGVATFSHLLSISRRMGLVGIPATQTRRPNLSKIGRVRPWQWLTSTPQKLYVGVVAPPLGARMQIRLCGEPPGARMRTLDDRVSAPSCAALCSTMRPLEPSELCG